jgi:MFS family permease
VSSRAGLARFGTVLALPGVRPVLVAAFIGRLPIGMMSLSIVILVSEETGSYATAGAVAATQALAGGVTSPLLGRLIDRIGQTPVLVGCAVTFPLCVAALIGVASTVDDLLPLIGVAIPFGATYPPLFAAVRALLTQMTGSEDLAATAFAFEAIVQEAFFIAGPLLVALLVAVASPQAALVFVAVVTSAGTLAFAATRASRSWRPGAGHERLLGALASPGVRTLLVVSAAFGMAFGTLEVTMPAFADERGSAATGGVLLAALALGSMLGGVWYGSRAFSLHLSAQMIRFCAVFAAALVPLAFAESIALMLILMAVAGFFVAPWAATTAALVGRLAPSGAVTEAYTWEMTAVIVGFALGGVLSGVLVENAGVRESLLAAAGLAGVSVATAWLRRETLRESVTAANGSGVG